MLAEQNTVAAERKELYLFSTDIAKVALRIAEKHGSTGEKWYVIELRYLLKPMSATSRAQVLFCSHVSGFDNVHIRGNLFRLEKAIKYGNSAGDR
jgi:hypothetical protein